MAVRTTLGPVDSAWAAAPDPRPPQPTRPDLQDRVPRPGGAASQDHGTRESAAQSDAGGFEELTT